MSELRTRMVLAGITVLAMIVISGMNHQDEARGAGMGTESKLPISSSHNISTHTPVTNREQIIELNTRDASWSVDGKQMVFARGSAVYLANGFGSVARQVYSGMGLVSAPQFSSDGEWIRFTVGNPERHATSLWEVSRDGSDAHALH